MKFLFWLATAVIYSNWLGHANGAPLELSIRYERDVRDVPVPAPIVLTWEAVPGRSYNVLAAEAPNSGAWTTLNSAPLIAETNRQAYRDLNSLDNRFYRVVELTPAVAVTHVGISEQAWRASDVWVPATQSKAVDGTSMLIALSAVWTAGVVFGPLPTDANGVFQHALNRVTNQIAHAPFYVQVGYQTNSVAGLHTVSPIGVGDSGDGFFLLLEVTGLQPGDSRVDTGHIRHSHPFYGPGDPNTIQTITVATDGAAARAGDLAVAIIGMDNNSNPDINITLPEGWTSLGYNDEVVDNIGYRACYKIVTTPGQQTVTCGWTDNSTFVAAAGIVVFRAAANN